VLPAMFSTSGDVNTCSPLPTNRADLFKPHTRGRLLLAVFKAAGWTCGVRLCTAILPCAGHLPRTRRATMSAATLRCHVS
jgi:hypothetical protein